MIKQLYTRITAILLTFIMFGLFAVSAQAQNATDEQAAAEKIDFINKDMIMGDENAPVELIEYVSVTCNHCATFHNTVLPRIKEKYVDTGKVKVVSRSFMLNGIDARISSLTRCVSEKRYSTFMDMLFSRQTSWYNIPEYQRLMGIHDQETATNMFIDHTMSEVEKMARQLGLNKKKIDACLNSKEVSEYLFNVQQEGIQKYKINATPTIVLNNRVVNNDYASIERAIENALN